MADYPGCFQFDGSALDKLMPMGVFVLPTGHIGRAGSTITKLRPDYPLVGQRFLEVFAITRPRRTIFDFAELAALAGKKLRLQFRQGAPIIMKGILVAENAAGGLLVNLSFGYHLVEAVDEYNLSNSDFAETELAIEMLYLIEAKNSVMEESRKLNLRLNGARLVAEEQALSDALTGVKNRRAMDQVLSRLSTSGVPFAVMHIDLDFFKAVNDSLGHAAGDRVLQMAATILVEETRDRDLVARVGGDEFVVIFEGLVDKKRLMKIGNRIVRRLKEPVEFEDKTCRISGSIGIAASDTHKTLDLNRLLSDADLALYASKKNGRGRVTMATEKFLAKPAQGSENIVKIAS